jgi:hypothetical protein
MKAAESQGGAGANGAASSAGEKRRRRWDQTAPADDSDPKAKKTAYDEVRSSLFLGDVTKAYSRCSLRL